MKQLWAEKKGSRRCSNNNRCSRKKASSKSKQKQSNKGSSRRRSRETQIPFVRQDNQLYILNRFGKQLAKWRTQPNTPIDEFEAILKRRYGEVEGDRIMHVLKIYSAGAHTRYHSRTGRNTIRGVHLTLPQLPASP